MTIYLFLPVSAYSKSPLTFFCQGISRYETGCYLGSVLLQNLIEHILQVDLTEYVEKHEFVFDAVLNEDVSNNEVSI